MSIPHRISRRLSLWLSWGICCCSRTVSSNLCVASRRGAESSRITRRFSLKLRQQGSPCHPAISCFKLVCKNSHISAPDVDAECQEGTQTEPAAPAVAPVLTRGAWLPKPTLACLASLSEPRSRCRCRRRRARRMNSVGARAARAHLPSAQLARLVPHGMAATIAKPHA